MDDPTKPTLNLAEARSTHFDLYSLSKPILAVATTDNLVTNSDESWETAFADCGRQERISQTSVDGETIVPTLLFGP